MDAEVSAAVAAWVAAGAAVVFGGTGLVLGILGYVRARKATDAAAQGNAIAEEANRIAKESAEVVAYADARAIEQHDVRWDGVWTEPGVYVVTNIGLHVAVGVVVQVRFRGTLAMGQAEEVGHGDTVAVEVPGVREFYDAKVAASGPWKTPGVIGFTAGPGRYDVEERVIWRSALGSPREAHAVRHLRLMPKADERP
ncbi:hypothetical protein ACQ143_06970 [Microbacterium sp. MC2]